MNIENLLNDDKQNGMAQNIFNILLHDNCTLHTVRCTLYSVHCILYILHYLYILHCTVNFTL